MIGTNSNYLIKCQLMASGCQHWRYSLGGATTNITLQYGSLYCPLTVPLLSASTSQNFESLPHQLSSSNVCPLFKRNPLAINDIFPYQHPPPPTMQGTFLMSIVRRYHFHSHHLCESII